MSSVFQTVVSTVLWSLLTTSLVLLISIPLGYLLARREFVGKNLLSTLVSLPMVLPPTAVGFLLLKIFADSGPLGRTNLGVDFDILLTWKGIILACGVMSFPLVIRTVRVSFEKVNPRLEVMSRTLGYGRLSSFIRVTLPLASRGLFSAAILGFTRSMGEFGATVIVAGNIPGKTQTLSSAIYSAQQSGNESVANHLLIVALSIGFVAVFVTEWLSQSEKKRGKGDFGG